jgi:hypothetical protein
MAPEDIADYAQNMIGSKKHQHDAYFLESVVDLAAAAMTPEATPGRPIQDAADEVAAVAAAARKMLEDLQAGWLWKLLTITPTPKARPCQTDATPTKKAEPCPHTTNSEQ